MAQAQSEQTSANIHGLLGGFSSSNLNGHLPKRRVNTASPFKAHSTQNVNSFQNSGKFFNLINFLLIYFNDKFN
jgi:hypothetical protein